MKIYLKTSNFSFQSKIEKAKQIVSESYVISLFLQI